MPSDGHLASDSSTRGVSSPPSYHTGLPSQVSLRGGYIRHEGTTEEHPSAASYFEERPCAVHSHAPVIRYPLAIDPGATRLDIAFPQPEQDYRVRDVTDIDWHTFLNYLLPNGPSDSKRSNNDEHASSRQQSRIKGVINEWNEGFFNPRGIIIQYDLNASTTSSFRSIPSEIPITFHTSGSQDLPPCYRGHSQGDSHHEEQYTHHRPPRPKHNSRHRSSSTSSSSSSSSSSSDSSVDSISSKDLNGLDQSQIQQAISNFRITAHATSLPAAINQLRAQLRSQHRAGGFSTRGNNGVNHAQLRTECRQLKAQIKDEVRTMKHARREQRQAWRQTKKEAKKERRGMKREAKKERKEMKREVKREAKAAWKEAKREWKAEKKGKRYGGGFRGGVNETGEGVDHVTRGVHQMGTGTGVGRSQESFPIRQETGVVGNGEGIIEDSGKGLKI